MAQFYTIRSGDTLGQIAARYRTSVAELTKANGIANANMIHAGVQLRIPHSHSTNPNPTEIVAPAYAPIPRPRPQVPQASEPAAPTLAPVSAPRPAPRPAVQPDTANFSTIRGLSRQDADALVRAVAAEARGESPAAQMAVAQTIINYARKNGQSIHRLVRTSYLSSNFDGNRKYYTMPMSRIPRLDTIRQAVAGAALGQSPIGNRSHFHDTSIRTPSFGNRSTRYQIGHLVFYNAK